MSETVTPDPSAGRQQIFQDPRGRRGPIALVLFVLLVMLGGVGYAGVLRLAAKPLPHAAQHDTAADFPRQVATQMARCARKNGEYDMDGSLQVPLIGQGVFQRVVQIAQDGNATYAVDPFTGRVIRLLTDLEQHATRSCRYAVEEYGVVPQNTIVLTYDDGPSAEWTPPLLGILRAYDVHATFFNIGVNILKNPQAFRAVVATGNAVGNHTLDHPELSKLTDTAARHELITNARIMAVVGHYQTRLFRTPYGGGDRRSIENNMYATMVAQQLGFTEVGFTDDTSDFASAGKDIPPPKLVRDGPGTLVLMHDGGGNRSSTLKLTIKFIQEAKGLGYHFMTVPQLLKLQGFSGVVTSHITPSLADYAGYWRYEAPTDLRVSWQPTVFHDMTLFVVGVSLFLLVGAFIGRYVNYRRPPTWQPKKVSIVIPCWRESEVIRRTVESILQFKEFYKFRLEIVLVDDGSADTAPGDTTWEVLQALAAEYAEVKALHKSNGGKAKALNYGLFHGVTTGLTLILDADTILRDKDTIPHMVRWFVDHKVGVVAAWTKAGYRGKGLRQRVISNYQALEYDLGIAVSRTFQDLTNSIVIVPGACSVFRTYQLRAVGGFRSHLIAEDAEMGPALRKAFPGMRIRQDVTAVALTEVPLSIKQLSNQWRRWTLGVMQMLVEHKDVFYRPDKYGMLTVQFWWSLYGMVVPPIFLPLSYAQLIVAAITGKWTTVGLYPLIFIGFRIIQTLASMILLRTWENPLSAIWYRLINDPLWMYLSIVCAWKVVTGRIDPRAIWTKLDRHNGGDLDTEAAALEAAAALSGA